jgi:hypothetical protein
MRREKITIMVIFQGQDGENLFNTKIQRIKNVNNKGCRIDVEFTNPVNYFVNSKYTIYEKVKEAIIKSDAAIAIVKEDPRDSISAGNLWLELGLYFAIKGRNLCWIAVDNRIKSIISDINGYEYFNFKDENDLINSIKKVVIQINEIKSNEEIKIYNNEKSKIQGSFKTKTKIGETEKLLWLDDKSYNCPKLAILCERRLHHLSFGSELIGINFELELLLAFRLLLVRLRDISIQIKNNFHRDSMLKNKSNQKTKGMGEIYPEIREVYSEFCKKTDRLFTDGEYKRLDVIVNEKFNKNSTDLPEKIKHRINYMNRRYKMVDTIYNYNEKIEWIFDTLEMIRERQDLMNGNTEIIDRIPDEVRLGKFLKIIKHPKLCDDWNEVIVHFKEWYKTFSDSCSIIYDAERIKSFHEKLFEAKEKFPHNTGIDYIKLWEEEKFIYSME